MKRQLDGERQRYLVEVGKGAAQSPAAAQRPPCRAHSAPATPALCCFARQPLSLCTIPGPGMCRCLSSAVRVARNDHQSLGSEEHLYCSAITHAPGSPLLSAGLSQALRPMPAVRSGPARGLSFLHTPLATLRPADLACS